MARKPPADDVPVIRKPARRQSPRRRRVVTDPDEKKRLKYLRRRRSEAVNRRHDQLNAELFGHLNFVNNDESWASDLAMEVKWPHQNLRRKLEHHFPGKTFVQRGSRGQLDQFGIRKTSFGKVIVTVEVKTNGSDINMAPTEHTADHGVMVQLRNFVEYCGNVPAVPILGYRHGLTEFFDLAELVSRRKRILHSQEVRDIMYSRMQEMYDWEFLHSGGDDDLLTVGEAVDVFLEKIPGFEYQGDLSQEEGLHCADIVGIRKVRDRYLVVVANARGNKKIGRKSANLTSDLERNLTGLVNFVELTQAPFAQPYIVSPWAATEILGLDRIDGKAVELYNFWLPKPIVPNRMRFRYNVDRRSFKFEDRRK